VPVGIVGHFRCFRCKNGGCAVFCFLHNIRKIFCAICTLKKRAIRPNVKKKRSETGFLSFDASRFALLSLLFRRFVTGLPDGLLQSGLRFGAAAGIGLVGPREKQVADGFSITKDAGLFRAVKMDCDC